MSADWAGWPPGWPMNERFLQAPQTCRRCGRQLQYTWGRVTPAGWQHKECAIAYAAEYTSSSSVVYVLTEVEDNVYVATGLEDETSEPSLDQGLGPPSTRAAGFSLVVKTGARRHR